MARVVVQLASKLGDERAEVGRLGAVGRAPHRLQQRLVAEEPARPGGERQEEAELVGGQRHLGAVPPKGATGHVQVEGTEAQDAGFGARFGAAHPSQRHPDPGLQLARVERAVRMARYGVDCYGYCMVAAGQAHAVIGLGGTQGTSSGASVMQQLPYGLGKLMVSTCAAGDTSAFVGIKDIMMMFSVSDILGLNPFMRKVLANAAGAACGMANVDEDKVAASNKPLIGMSNLGVLTSGAEVAVEYLESKGYEVILFHAVGAGGVGHRFVPTDLLPRCVDAGADHRGGDAVGVGGVAPGEATQIGRAHV